MSAERHTAIVAFDGSPAAGRAVAAAAKILGACRVLVVTVWEEGLAYSAPLEMPYGAPDDMMITSAVPPDVAQEVDRDLHDHAERVSGEGAALAKSLGLDAQPLAVPEEEGNIARTILNVAREREAAAIVVGSRGLGGIRARLEGSTSRGLLKHATCPVIVVHDEENGRG